MRCFNKDNDYNHIIRARQKILPGAIKLLFIVDLPEVNVCKINSIC